MNFRPTRTKKLVGQECPTHTDQKACRTGMSDPHGPKSLSDRNVRPTRGMFGAGEKNCTYGRAAVWNGLQVHEQGGNSGDGLWQGVCCSEGYQKLPPSWKPARLELEI